MSQWEREGRRMLKGARGVERGDMKAELHKYISLSSFTSRLIQKCSIMTTIEAG